MAASPVFGNIGGKGWEWIGGGFLLGGIWLIYKKVITWHIPVAMLGALFAIALVFYLIDADTYASPWFHLVSGASLLGAFFIATDPVSAATTNPGRLVYAAGIGILTYIIRTWGGYPDGVAFAVLLMNMTAPTIDYYIRPRVFGHGKD
jgi:electron transport complex protein RnfD